MKLAPPRTSLELASLAQRDRLPSALEILSQLGLYRNGVTAAKIADNIGAKVSRVLEQLCQLRQAGWVQCDDQTPAAWSIWHKIDHNPRPTSYV